MASNTHSLNVVSASSQSLVHNDNASFDITGNLTIEAWIKPNSLTDSWVVSKWADSVGGGGSYEFGINGTGIKCAVSDGSNFDNEAVTATLYAGSWNHIAMTYSTAGTVKFYLNGIQAGSDQTTTSTSINNSPTKFRIGGNTNSSGDGANFFDGLIDDVRVWNTVRTATEIAENYNKQLVGNESGLVAYYQLNNSLNDTTANALNLTNINSATFSTTVPYPNDDQIALNGTAQGAVNSGTTTLTVSHTCSGLNRILFAYVAYQGVDVTISGVTHAGNAMTAIYTNQTIAGALTHALYYIVAPTVGAQNVVVTMSGSTGQRLGMHVTSYVGAKQTGVPDASNFENSFSSVANRTMSVTTVADNSWIVGGVMSGDTLSAGANTIIRTVNASPMDYAVRIYDSNGAKTPAGSNSVTINVTPNNGLPMLIASFAPISAGTAYSIAVDVGAFVLTGIANTLRIALNMVTTVGEFALTGVDVLFALGKGITADVGQFVLTGFDAFFVGSRTMATTVGEFILTGIDAGLGRAYNLVANTASFILTGMAIRLPIFWRNVTKNVVTVRNVRRSNI